MATMNPPPIQVQQSSSSTTTTIDNSLSIYSPLLISMLGIIGTCIAIIAYHLFLVQYCISTRRRSTAPEEEEEAQLPHPAGVDVKLLQTIPILTYAAVKGGAGADQDECVVCLGELMDEEKVRLLPNCRHAFHVPCIDLWFAAHASCPMCRSPIAEAIIAESPILDPATAADDYPESGESSTAASGSSETSPREQQSHFGLLRHCASVVLPIPAERRAPPQLKRSVSTGQTTSFVVIDLEGVNNSETNASSLSPSFSGGMLTWSTAGSVSHFDRVSVKWLRSFSLMRLGKPSNRRILPY
ncbi:hypothetical protein ABFX02_10G047300 [Erythranthe guttata]